MNEDRLTVDDMVRAGVCARGMRRWFADNAESLPEGVDFRSFIREGVPLEMARQVKDGVIERAIALKESRNG